jgi:hypothetical protein
MKERTIAEAVVEVLKAAKEPMTAAEITQVILDKGLYEFNTKDQVGMVRRAINRRCEGYERKDSVLPNQFEKLSNGNYRLKHNS